MSESGMDAEHVSRVEAERLLDEAVYGTLILTKLEPVPVLGESDELPFEAKVETYTFGRHPDELE